MQFRHMTRSRSALRLIRISCITLAVLLLLPLFWDRHLQQLSKQGYEWEAFDSSLQRLRTIDQLLAHLDQHPEPATSLSKMNQLAGLVRRRFYHGYSHYSLQENWLAAFSGLLWNDLSAIVKPDDILKYPMAACSQQAIVLMECSRRLGLTYRPVKLGHHYTTSVRIDGSWYYFDPNVEPLYQQRLELSTDAPEQNLERLTELYRSRFDSAFVQRTITLADLGPENAMVAKNARLFHSITFWLSRTLWLLPLLVLLVLLVVEKRNKARRPRSGQAVAARPTAV